jgi:hypothetical protein
LRSFGQNWYIDCSRENSSSVTKRIEKAVDAVSDAIAAILAGGRRVQIRGLRRSASKIVAAMLAATLEMVRQSISSRNVSSTFVWVKSSRIELAARSAHKCEIGTDANSATASECLSARHQRLLSVGLSFVLKASLPSSPSPFQLFVCLLLHCRQLS